LAGDTGSPGRVDAGDMGVTVSLELMVAFPLTVQTGHTIKRGCLAA
jgi:hypothetical protein